MYECDSEDARVSDREEERTESVGERERERWSAGVKFQGATTTGRVSTEERE